VWSLSAWTLFRLQRRARFPVRCAATVLQRGGIL